MEKGINVLSAFNGMGNIWIALDRAGVKVNKRYSSEIDKYATIVNDKNYPDTVQLGDITKWREWNIDWSSIDLLAGGSPCQGFSSSGKHGGTKAILNGIENIVSDRETYIYMKSEGAKFLSHSYLFWEFVLLLDHIKIVNPNIKFLLENVKMSTENISMISMALGVNPEPINSSLVSAQNRLRYYWANWIFSQPLDKGIKLSDIVEDFDDKGPGAIRGRYVNKATILGRRLNSEGKREDYNKKIPVIQCLEVRASNRNKSNCLTTVDKDNVLTSMPIGRHVDAYGKHTGIRLPFRDYTTLERERLQTVPEGFTNSVSESQANKMLGNGWTVDVIAHILSFM